MACFLAPAAEAVIVTAVKRRCKKEEEAARLQMPADAAPAERPAAPAFSQKLGWLTNMLWGGSFLLAIEHVWHGEIVPWPPFLTALYDPADIQPMLTEIATAGVGMAVLVTAVWGLMLLAHGSLAARAERLPDTQGAEG